MKDGWMIKALNALLKLASSIFTRTSSLSKKTVRFILCLIGTVRLAILLISISRKVGILMLPILHELWQNWSSFALTPNGLSMISLWIFVSCSIIILTFLFRILHALKISLTTLLKAVKALLLKRAQARAAQLPAQQQAKALEDISKAQKKIDRLIEVVNNAECRFYSVRGESDECQKPQK